jgi:hypothetical protein
MMNNLNLINYTEGAGWQPIGQYITGTDHSKAFQGNFNGNGNLVLNLRLNRPTERYTGLFGVCFNAYIQNLGIENCNVVGKDDAGGLAGSSNNTDFSNCYVTGNVKGTNYLGGLLGTHGGSIKNCYAATKVSGTEQVGGLVGRSSANVTITNCYAINYIDGTNNIGGLVGRFSSGAVGAKNCIIATDSLILHTSVNTIGRISSNGTHINNYAKNDMVVKNALGDITITEGLNTKDGKSVPVDSLQSFYFYATAKNWNESAWDITATPLTNPDAIWRICDKKDFPFLMWQNRGCNIFTITATAGDNGNIYPNGPVSVPEYEKQIFTFTPNTGYQVDSLFIDGVYHPEFYGADSYTFENVETDHTIHVTFTLKSGINDDIFSKLIVYPNPTTGELKFESGKLKVNNIEIYDVYGRILLQKSLSTFNSQLSTKINISALPAGIYFLRINTEKGMVTKKVVKY